MLQVWLVRQRCRKMVDGATGEAQQDDQDDADDGQGGQGREGGSRWWKQSLQVSVDSGKPATETVESVRWCWVLRR